MSNSKVTVSVGIWTRFQTHDLQIAPSLTGMAHEFDHHGCRVKIQLPGKPRQFDWRNGSSNIQCFQYRQRNGRKYPYSYLVNSVNMIIETEKTRNIPQNSIGTVDSRLFGSRQIKSLDSFTERYEAIADSAFERWLDVLRWKTGIHTICPHQENLQKSHGRAYLIDLSTNRYFYRPPYRITVTMLATVSRKDWRLVQVSLENNIDVPIWHLYISEANQKRDAGDVRGFILSLAISIETMVRALMNTYIVKSSAPAFESAIARIGIVSILDKWGKINSNNKSWENLKDEIKLVKFIIDERNSIMHRGALASISINKAKEIAKAVSIFIEAGENQIRKT